MWSALLLGQEAAMREKSFRRRKGLPNVARGGDKEENQKELEKISHFAHRAEKSLSPKKGSSREREEKNSYFTLIMSEKRKH